jgi:hypothetical protein
MCHEDEQIVVFASQSHPGSSHHAELRLDPTEQRPVRPSRSSNRCYVINEATERSETTNSKSKPFEEGKEAIVTTNLRMHEPPC